MPILRIWQVICYFCKNNIYYINSWIMSKKKTNPEKPSKSSDNNTPQPQNNKTFRVESSNSSNVSLNFLEKLDTVHENTTTGALLM